LTTLVAEGPFQLRRQRRRVADPASQQRRPDNHIGGGGIHAFHR